MKKHLLFLSMILATFILRAQVGIDSVITGEGYPDEVYYNLENGVVSTVARSTWDLGFNTTVLSVSILSNAASGVELYPYPAGDTADWATLDTTGMTWTPLYNSIESWDEGAFGATATGHPDYGWGIYNDVTHIITGDSLYVIKTVAGTYKKLAIVERNPMVNNYTIRVAGLDGSDDTTIVVNSAEYNTKLFVYYSLDNMEIVDREPARETWDMVFARYYDYTIPYMVSGVLTNETHVMAQEVREEGLDQATFVDYEESAFSSNISIIGSDWKSFSTLTFTYEVDTTVVYFLKKDGETDSTYYKLYFTAFDYTQGKYVFVQEELSAVSSRAPEASTLLNLYPNPASDHLNLVYDHLGEMEVSVYDLTGRNVFSTIHQGAGFNQLVLDISSLERGVFFVQVRAGGSTEVLRFIKE